MTEQETINTSDSRGARMIYHETEHGVLHCGNCLEVLRTLPDNSVDSVVTDPPYGLSFMGKKWDYDVPSVDIWQECLRVLKPGGYLLSFAGTRTQHRIACGIEDAGFEIRDMIAWVYGSGFPKSLNVGKAIDKLQGIEINELPTLPMQEATDIGAISKNRRCAVCGKAISSGNPCQCDRTYKAQNEWQGWGTALKPALEPITVARKPVEGTVAANVLKWGTGAIDIDGCRVEGAPRMTHKDGNMSATSIYQQGNTYNKDAKNDRRDNPTGRFPANLIHDGSDEVLEMFPESKAGKTGRATTPSNPIKLLATQTVNHIGHNDSGSAARFFYCAKASKAERQAGNIHPTVKPIALMRYPVRLVTPPNGTVLDPFLGSGTTAIAAIQEGYEWIGIEREKEYCEIAARRIETELEQTDLFREEQ